MLTTLTKPAWQSKTLWFNLLAAVATYALNHMGAAHALGLSPEAQTVIVIVANALLRLVTYTGISLSGKP